MKYRFIIFFVFFAFGITASFAQSSAISFPELEIQHQKSPRPVIVFLHAPWCQFCDNMKRTTFQDDEAMKVLSENFYFVSFDGESKADVKFLGNTFRYKPTGANTGVHELAEQLGTKNGLVSYPTVTFLNEKYEIIYQNDGFLSARKLKQMLRKVLEELEKSK
ncbi:thioredoxin family protein [Roseivirga sp.]|uniref:thioredoxin family protein n=1 Tax=Roseivirga sp. TaxID=1964215 RepID=UPI003B8AA426